MSNVKRILKWLFGILLIAIAALFLWGYAPDTDPLKMRAKYANATSQFVDVGNGLKIHIRDEGRKDGPVLVLLHGSNSSLHIWEPWLQRLGNTYRIISVDQIGHGLTGPNPSRDYSAKAFVDTLDIALTRLNVDRFALAGTSMGGWVAWEYALVHPQKVTDLILINSAGPPNDAPLKLSLGYRVQQTPMINQISTFITPRSLVDGAASSTVSNPAQITDAEIDRIWELVRYPGNRQATLDIIRAAPSRNEHLNQVSSIKTRTLILWGADDKNLPVSGADWFTRQIPGSVKIIYEKVGHLPMEEVPDRSAQDVEAFLQSSSAAKH
jgi:pimeloyl-ACP methyl ester carboxylesterase